MARMAAACRAATSCLIASHGEQPALDRPVFLLSSCRPSLRQPGDRWLRLQKFCQLSQSPTGSCGDVPAAVLSFSAVIRAQRPAAHRPARSQLPHPEESCLLPSLFWQGCPPAATQSCADVRRTPGRTCNFWPSNTGREVNVMAVCRASGHFARRDSFRSVL